MSSGTILDFVLEDIYTEISEDYSKYREISNSLLLSLHNILGQPLVPALHLIDGGAVTSITTASGKQLYKVSGLSGSTYYCTLQYCPCMSFAFGVVKHAQLKTCKHIIAVKISLAMGIVKSEEVSDSEFAQLMFQ